MSVPVRLVWKSFIDAVVEVLVVGEDDMDADVVELAMARLAGRVEGDQGG